jgi:OTU domain-containing protein 6
MDETEEQMLSRHERELQELKEKFAVLLGQFKPNEKKKIQNTQKQHQKEEDELLEIHQQDIIDMKLSKMSTQEEKKVEKQPKENEDEKRAKKREQNKKKTEKKKEKLEKQREEAIRDLKQSGGSERDKELVLIKKTIEPLGLSIVEIESDGHCLYRAVAHQLKEKNIEETDFKQIRKRVANHMRKHKDDFIHFLETSSGDMMTDQEYNKYCDRVESSADWGGQVELLALVNVLNLPIRIFTSGPPIEMGEHIKADPITLSFHRNYYALGE